MRVVRAKRIIGCCLILVVAGLLSGLASGARGTTIWIDTDPSIGLPVREVDDAFALILAFHSPEIRIAGISTTYGNASLGETIRIARHLVARFARKKCRIYAGARGRTNLGCRNEATEALATALHKERLTYIALGPLTNLATFLRLHPELAARIEKVIFVGGQTSVGQVPFRSNNWLSIHDANVLKDPAAVAEVMKSRCPIDFAPIETSIQLQVTADDRQRMRHTVSGEFLYHRTHLWFWFWRGVVGLKGGPVFDALPILAVIRPDLFLAEKRFVRLTEDYRLILEQTQKEGAPARRSYGALTERSRQLLLERL
jgi:inosine-uridine nucleoside N-ribohydrolase